MGRVISRLEDKGLNILAMKMLRVTPDLARQHYAEHVHKPFYPGLEAFITGGPVVAMVVEGTEVIPLGPAQRRAPPSCLQRNLWLTYKAP
jgi:nucleoside-diphosphate kinase